MDATKREALNSAGLLILRLGMGVYMATHGWGKVQMVLDGKFEQFGDPIGIGKTASLILAAGAEFVCALLVAVGLGTRLAAIPVVFTMAVAAFIAHSANPWTAGEGYRLYMEKQAESWASREPAMMFLVGFLALVFTGAGKYSVDALLTRSKGAGAAPAPKAG